MKEYKIRQELFHRLNRNYRDDLSQFEIEIDDNIVDSAVRYFMETDVGWIYPAKSYMVAICYSKWLSEEFGEDPMHYLNEPNLLYGNDPYYVPYKLDPQTYDNILSKIGGWDFNEFTGIVPDVKEYFLEEFLIND